jgi:hypothetical protein
MWGLFRVLPNTCATGGITGLPCLGQAAPPPPPVPAVTLISPASGPTSGGTVVSITGTGFSTASGATTVNFIPGGSTANSTNAATNVSCSSATSCSATSPAGPAGNVDVHVTVAGQQSPNAAADQFTYVAPPAPAVTLISPASGPTSGGTVVTITGSGFSTTAGATTVNFIPSGSTANSTNAATGVVSCLTTTSCTATSPAGSAGKVDVHVTVAGVQSPNAAADQFTYTAPPGPAVTAISPTSGPATGSTVVSISGSGFSTTAGATTVKFGATAATNVACTTTTNCTATSPAGSGTVDVVVTVGTVQSGVTAADRFTYVVAPTMTTVNMPVPALSKGNGYWFTFTSTGAGTVGATWISSLVQGTLAIYAGNPFAGKTDPVKLSPPAGALVTFSGKQTSFIVTTPSSQPAGVYTAYFFAGAADPASSGTVSYMK